MHQSLRRSHSTEYHLPRKPNYDFEKRRKEQERAAKKEAKREEKQRRKEAGLPDVDEFNNPEQSDGTHHA